MKTFYEMSVDRYRHIYGLQAKVRQDIGTLNDLSPREAYILHSRFSVGKDERPTFVQLGHELSLSTSRVREIEARALRILYSTKAKIAFKGICANPSCGREAKQYYCCTFCGYRHGNPTYKVPVIGSQGQKTSAKDGHGFACNRRIKKKTLVLA
jgi:hypothetical protein